MSKPILVVTVKRDQHGNPPSERQIKSVARKVRRAVAESGYTHSVLVVPDTVEIKTVAV